MLKIYDVKTAREDHPQTNASQHDGVPAVDPGPH